MGHRNPVQQYLIYVQQNENYHPLPSLVCGHVGCGRYTGLGGICVRGGLRVLSVWPTERLGRQARLAASLPCCAERRAPAFRCCFRIIAPVGLR